MDTIKVLTQVRGYLSNPDNWVKRTLYHDHRRCLLGAVFDVIGCQDREHPVFYSLFENTKYPELPMSVHILAGYNDRMSHDELLAWLDNTIAAEKAKRGVEALKGEIKTIPITEAVAPETEILVH